MKADNRVIDHTLVEDTYRRALAELKQSASSYGFRAAPKAGENYNAVWGRDGSICAIASFETGDPELVELGLLTLSSLAEHQASNGQLPAYLLLEEDRITKMVHGGIGNITAIDANLWFVIACQTAIEKLNRQDLLEDRFRDVYRRTLMHLQSIDSDACGLLEIPMAGDWSDLLDRAYHILFDQVLWWRVLWGAATLGGWCESEAERELYIKKAEEVRGLLNERFWWDSEGRKAAYDAYLIGNTIPSEDRLYYQCHLQPFHNIWYERFDSLANVLAALSGISNEERREEIINQVYRRRLDQPAPLRVLDPVVQPGDDDWLELYHEKQPPYEYHNGGIWPLAGGFWISLLAKAGRQDEARLALSRLAKILQAKGDSEDSFGFHEYFHGKTGEPLGCQHQAWSAAAYVLAYHAVEKGLFGCFEDPPRDL